MNVLFVEDEPETRAVTAEVMRGLGHAVIDVDSAETALALLRKIAFDAMVTDVGLPGMPGDVLAAEARVLQPRVRIVFATGLDRVPAPENDPGPVVLRKPYSPEDLDAALNDAR